MKRLTSGSTVNVKTKAARAIAHAATLLLKNCMSQMLRQFGIKTPSCSSHGGL
jgi:hypothetical protein